ncbi:MAG: F0F1 ATP synthase subunit A [Solitalea-like symbiont of Tyrophagus putrescentiae]
MQRTFTNTVSFYLSKHKYICYFKKNNNRLLFLNDIFYKIALFLILFFTNIIAPSFATTSSNDTEGLEPNKKIIHHVSNSHQWEIFNGTNIYLPIILLTNKGFEVFSSKNLINKAIYKGRYYSYDLDHDGHLKAFANLALEKSPIIIDLSITKNVASMFFAAILMLTLFTCTARSYGNHKGKLKGLASVIEPFIIFIRDEIAKPNIGTIHYQKYMPFLLTLFFFICINNLIGLVPIPPGNVNVTGNISVTIALGFITFIVVNVSGNKYYWKHILKPDVPFYLIPIMILVEFIGLLSKPFALIVRLFANITAGHIIILSLVFLIFILKSFWVTPISVFFVLFMYILELLVAFLQAYIFTLLTALFIGGAKITNEH